MNTVPPFGLSVAQLAAYLRGAADAVRPPVILPAMTAPAAQPIDRQYTVPAGGTIVPVLAQAAKDGSKWPGVNYIPGASYFEPTALLPKGFSGITVSGGPSLSGCATIESDASGVGNAAIHFGALPNVRIRNLAFKSTSTKAARAIYCNGAANGWIDNVLIDGFAIGICSDGSQNLTLSNFGVFNEYSPGTGKAQGVFLAAAKNWSIYQGTFVHDGWDAADYDGSTQEATQLQLNHGVYINNDSALTTDGVIRGSIFVDCAASGINSRVGGTYDTNVFRGNGRNFDCLVEGVDGSVTNSVIFGSAVDAAPYWGGGIQIYSQHATVDGNYIFGSAKSQLDPAILADWAASMGALPAGMTATFSNNFVQWMNDPFAAHGGRTFVDGGGNRTSKTIQGQSLPTLEAFHGCTAAQLYDVLRSRVGMGDAALYLDWARRSVA